MKYWLIKSEPTTYSLDDLKKEDESGWDGVRNYQARNFMRDEMKVGDLCLFYHSNTKPPGVVGICKVSEINIPDPTAFDPKSPYFDPKSDPSSPRWIMVQVQYVKHFENYIPIDKLRKQSKLQNMMILQKGSRLSITPVTKAEFDLIQKLGSRYNGY